MHILGLHICMISTGTWEVQDYKLSIHNWKIILSNFMEIKTLKRC